MPDLTTAVGNCCFPVLSGTTAPSEAVLPLGAVLPLTGRGTTALYQFPPYSYLSVIFLLVFCGLYSFFLVVCVFLCVVPGDELPEHQARRINLGRATSKRYRTTESVGGSSSAPPPPQLKKKSAI